MKAHSHKNNFTHFASLPFIRKTHRLAIQKVQDIIEKALTKQIDPKKIRRASNLLMHLTLGMLTLPDAQMKQKAINIFDYLKLDF